ncbi:hypothetical protein TrLO_g1280 [Triparma laevis f. longispina]|uniref:BART domain-containing protein n=1 Tax=Triparma laevis f. longispina TaxID=1714387 RepID=A0A9W7KRY5_9STRA|nr:hypothetical protein TrLO_g1280 [Triparma laevis f. longispina]
MPSEERKEESKVDEKKPGISMAGELRPVSSSLNEKKAGPTITTNSINNKNTLTLSHPTRHVGAPTMIDRTIVTLIDWGTSAEFESELSGWIKDHCEDFSGSLDLAEEQPLSLGTIFNDYCEWLDGKLGDFCDDENLDPDDVSKKMAECLSANKEEEFFPAFMAITEYDEFARQMHDIAVARMRMGKADDAVEIAAEEGGFNISGTWEADPDAYDPEGAEEALKMGACPWVFRKVLKRASKFVKDITIKQTDVDVEFAFTIHLFGTTVNRIEFGHPVTIKNLWKKDIQTTYTLESDRLCGVQTGHPGVPEGVLTDDSVWTLLEDNNKLVWTTTLSRADMDEDVVYRQVFLRKGAGGKGRRK